MSRRARLLDLMRGGWLSALAPLLTLLLVIARERLDVPYWILSLLVIALWFGSFFALIRAQFARRHRNEDVFKAFCFTTAVGFTLVIAVMFGLFLRGSP